MATRIKASASASASAVRRRIKRRSERASHKKKTNATLRSRKQRARKTAKVMRKVMRGGIHESIAYEHALNASLSQLDEYRNADVVYIQPMEQHSAFMLYDHIPGRADRDTFGTYSIDIEIPICIIVIIKKLPLDDIYLFFNKEMTKDDALNIVKVLLGINEKEEFQIDQEIEWDNEASEPSEPGPTCKENSKNIPLSKTYLKLKRCPTLGRGLLTYCLSYGNSIDRTEIDIKIQTTNRTYKSLTGKKIRADLKDQLDGFKHRFLTSKAGLPELYKDFFIPYTYERRPPAPEVTDEIFKEYFGDDIEGFDDAFKQKMREKIVEHINSIHNLNYRFCLESNKIDDLNRERPLKVKDTTIDVPKNFSTKELFEAVKYWTCVLLRNSSYAKKWYLNQVHHSINRETNILKTFIDRRKKEYKRDKQ